MLSKKTKYALKALIHLAKQGQQEPVLIVDIAEKENIPRKFLEAILLELRNHGFLESKKGKGGGYFLKMLPENIFVLDILRLMNGPIAMVPCASHRFYAKCDECREEESCSIRDLFVELRNKTLEVLEDKSLADLLMKEEMLKSVVLEFA